MQNWRRSIAWGLIVLLIRVFSPEAAVLRLHQHQHTEDAPVAARATKSSYQAELSVKHQHCHVDELYNAPFQPVAPVALDEPVRLLAYAVYRPQAPVCRASHLLDGASLRGPPTRGA
ncbi:hypothetical protein [Hymenobacter sp. YC55]|uniref:hypothetical protein n=1 Tax=Hymenobacter sp. YC55 TaxID=3034019 RepID=UPI0023FA2985|nr:hypothetical protein [Hymenobacter sp. YC55]MDF7815827.1 hypothetical protein [Hymenobacter sp. YC55]